MKLTIIGGGGIRAPLVIKSAIRRAGTINLDEICLMDIDEEQLQIIGRICQFTAQAEGSKINVSLTTDANRALTDADYVITTIRVGKEMGRVMDERIALSHHVLGQETTGPGGFAMAMRSIPAITKYAELMTKLCPRAWMFNFTNPAGLVTQALRDSGFDRIIGICDGANASQHWAAKYLGVSSARIQSEVFGLNHLSWSRSILLDGEEKIPDLLADLKFLAESDLRVFEPELIQLQKLWLNEYLYYYHYADKALNSILSEKHTRGEEVLTLNKELLEKLSEINPYQHPAAAMKAYWAYNERRGATYMNYANPTGPSMEEADKKVFDGSENETFSEGYAGVALDIVEAFESGKQIQMALNIPNAGAMNCVSHQDVVEVSCKVSREGIFPLSIGDVPPAQEVLIRTVKQYERLTVEAIRTRSIKAAYQALMAHPLVLSYSLAKTLVDEYLVAHAEYVGNWS